MTTTRYFEVKVTGCKNCPYRCGDMCYHYKMDIKPVSLCEKVYEEKTHQLTPSCPMWNEIKESETKDAN